MNPSFYKAGSWTSKSVALRALPPALDSLVAALSSRLQRATLDETQRAALESLERRLTALRGQQPDRALFEEIVRVCYAYEHHRTESFLGFLYGALRPSLVSYTVNQLRKLGARQDVDAVALDLVGALFTELAEAYMEEEDGSSLIPPATGMLNWLFKALRRDVMDHCKSAANRLEQSIEPLMDEGYEQAVDRLSWSRASGRQEDSWSPVDAVERREAFLVAFQDATAGLKPRHREVLRLRELEGADVERIAGEMNLTRQKVLDLLQYAREKRAQLLCARLRSLPALADLHHRSEEMTALFQKVKLGSFTERLRPSGPPGGGRLSPLNQESAWLPMDDPRREGGAEHARGRRKL